MVAPPVAVNTGSPRLRILLVTRNLPPLVGGMEQLNWHMAEELSKVADVHVVGPEGAAALAPSGVEIHEVPLKPLPRFLLRAGACARRQAKRWQPDIVLAGSGLTAPLAGSAARLCSARTAIYVHGLDVAVKSYLYRRFWLPALRRADRVIANSRATAELCRGIGVKLERIGIVHPGVELPEAPRENSHAEDTIATFRTRNNLGERPILLSVGRFTERKGLREFVTRCLPQINAVYPDVLLLVVGEAPRQSLHARAQTPASIQAAADAAGLGSHIRFLGVITDRERLAEIYQSADVHVFPVREIPDDPEGFGMVALEAAAHGLPTVAFATGGVAEAVAEGRSGRLITPENYSAFATAVLDTLTTNKNWDSRCRSFAKEFAWPEFGKGLADALLNTVSLTPVGRAGKA